MSKIQVYSDPTDTLTIKHLRVENENLKDFCHFLMEKLLESSSLYSSEKEVHDAFEESQEN